MKIVILGAAGQIGRLLTTQLLKQTKADLVLYAKNATKRLKINIPERETLIDGDFQDNSQLIKAINKADIVYINDMGTPESTIAIIKAMKMAGVKRVIAASVLGIYNEVPGAFGKWNERMSGLKRIAQQTDSAKILEESNLDYTLLRLTWLYNQQGNTQYMLTNKGEPFVGAQVTREAVTQLIVDIIKDTTDQFIGKSLGVSEPNTNWDKPSFY